jgi:putative transposase
LTRDQAPEGGEGNSKKGHPVLRKPKAIRFRFVEEHTYSFPANRLCDVVGVSTRVLCAFRNRPASRRQRSDLITLAHIKEQYRLSLGSYRRPRMTEELKEIGLDVGHRRVGRLMRQSGITVVRTRKQKVTIDSDHKFNIAPNLLDRDFIADAPNHKWARDNSYIWTREGWLYLAVMLDLHSRCVVGWAVSNCMKRDLAIRALKMAIAFRSPPKGCIHHTDRGSQYCSHDHQKVLCQHGFRVLMSGKGNCYKLKDGLRSR